jgi:hypothetical protein
VLDAHARLSLPRLLAQLVAGFVVAVVVYVPVHEGLHALGCVGVGGEVTRLEIALFYGGMLLARLFPVVSTETAYAGRLAGFDVGGSDLRLLATDFAPYVLTVLVGVPLLRDLRRHPRAWLVPAALLLALAPWVSLPGDYYEMGSVIVTALLARLGGDWSALRSDDLIALGATLRRTPETLGVATTPALAAAVGVVLASCVVGLALAGATYGLGRFTARRLGL